MVATAYFMGSKHFLSLKCPFETIKHPTELVLLVLTLIIVRQNPSANIDYCNSAQKLQAKLCLHGADFICTNMLYANS